MAFWGVKSPGSDDTCQVRRLHHQLAEMEAPLEASNNGDDVIRLQAMEIYLDCGINPELNPFEMPFVPYFASGTAAFPPREGWCARKNLTEHYSRAHPTHLPALGCAPSFHTSSITLSFTGPDTLLACSYTRALYILSL